MPPSSSTLRRSSGRNPRADYRKRGRSLEGGLLSQAKNDDLALFNKVENRAKDNFSLYSLDSFDELSSSRLQRLSKIKLGISIPVQEKSNGLLNADDEKNEYDWLLTPPDTPLFPSLEYETPQVNHAHRGKRLGQTVSIPRFASAEKSNRTIRGSATPQQLNQSPQSNKTNRSNTSPHRRSPSPQSRNGTLLSRGRQSSGPHRSSPLHSRSMSTLPSKSAPGSRFSTPTSQRTSTVSSGMASSGKRGTSPVNKSPRNSGSFKVQQDWDSVPGFSMDVPPNLRTSLSGRPVSRGRSSPPAPRNGTSSSMFGRQSMSPTASRSPKSLHSFGRDQCNHQNKESVASSGDNHTESPLSTIMSIFDQVEERKAGLVPKSGHSVFSKKSLLTLCTTLDPTRSADSALQQTGQKSPQSMFTPFPSSVPNTTGKENSGYSSMISNYSLATTSCIMSSEQGRSFVVDINGSTKHDQDDLMVIERGLTAYPEVQGEIFTLNEAYDRNNERHESPDEKSIVAHHEFDTHSTDGIEAGLTRNFSLKRAATEIVTTVTEPAYVANSILGVDCDQGTPTCSKCSKNFCITRLIERNGYVYLGCCEKDECVTMGSLETTVVGSHNSRRHSELTPEENRSYDKLEPRIDLQENTSGSASMLCRSKTKGEQGESGVVNSPVKKFMVEEKEQRFANQRMLGQPIDSTQHELKIGHSSKKSDVAEAAGISVLTNVSNSSKWPVVQGNSVATNIPSDDPSYARDYLSSVSSSAGHNSILAESSVNFSSPCGQDQLIGKEVNIESSQHDSNTLHHSCMSSLPKISNHSYQAHVLAISSDEENGGPVENEEKESLEKTLVAEEQGTTLNYTESDDRSSSHIEADFLKVNEICRTENCGIPCNPTSELSKNTSIQLDTISIQRLSNNGFISFDNMLNLSDEETRFSDLERPDMISESDSHEEDAKPDNVVDLINVQTPSSLVLASEDLRNSCDSSPVPQRTNLNCPNPESITSDQDYSASMTLQNNTSVSPSKSHILGHTCGILEEPTVTLEVPGGHIRSLTLEQIADTTLFCRSIIQKVVYQATTIAVEKENRVCLEGLHPMVTTVNRPSSGRKDLLTRTSSRHAMKILKAKCCVERDGMTTSPITETSIKPIEPLKHDSMASRKVNRKRLPKLCSNGNCTVM